MIAMEQYLEKIFMDFKSYIAGNHKLCELKKVNFDQGNLPDYHNVHVQQYYLLRYAYGYAYEYVIMYRSLFQRMENSSERSSLNVMSIGCGSMIDFWALVKVNELYRKKGKAFTQIFYTGIDIVSWYYNMWQYCAHTPRGNQVEFYHEDILQFLREQSDLQADVYIFPKSISEFSEHEMSTMGRLFSEKIPPDKTVYFLFSLRADEYNQRQDMRNTEHLYKAMTNAGFQSTDFVDLISKSKIGEQHKIYLSRIGLFRNCADITEQISWYLYHLHEKCITFQCNGIHCMGECENRLSRRPILYDGYATWQLFEFRKGN